MTKRLSAYVKGGCYHGYAGLASAFAVLADRKLKPGGVMALVLPLSSAAGISWGAFRHMLASRYTELAVLSMAASDSDALSFSADTDMAECLIIARKLKGGEEPSERIRFASLNQRPQGLVGSSVISQSIMNADYSRNLEDGPYGGMPVVAGSRPAGVVLEAPSYTNGDAWAEVRLADYSLAQTAYGLAHSRLWLPGLPRCRGFAGGAVGPKLAGVGITA